MLSRVTLAVGDHRLASIAFPAISTGIYRFRPIVPPGLRSRR
jgi:O-acetyl-ADP-ribose deacetylase (regulator of RNase III)